MSEPARNVPLTACKVCDHVSGDDWSQCPPGQCPHPASPHHTPAPAGGGIGFPADDDWNNLPYAPTPPSNGDVEGAVERLAEDLQEGRIKDFAVSRDIDTLLSALSAHQEREARAFALGERVKKTKGSSWQGRVVGFYATALTPVGYAVESEREPGSVQIYPQAALQSLKEPRP